jgi:CheY-like chemotaxis protein
VDDDESFLKVLSDYFSESGYVVDIARTPEEALQLIQKEKPRSYQLVITDFDFGELSSTKGDEFLLQNSSLFRGATVAIISGTTGLTADKRARLEEAGMRFLQKTPDTVGRLEEMAEEVKERLASDIVAIFAKEMTPRIEEQIGSGLSMELMPRSEGSSNSKFAELLKRVVVDWLKSREGQDVPAFAYGAKVYSASELAEEVRHETEVGLAHVTMLLDEFQSFLGSSHDGGARGGDDEPET